VRMPDQVYRAAGLVHTSMRWRMTWRPIVAMVAVAQLVESRIVIKHLLSRETPPVKSGGLRQRSAQRQIAIESRRHDRANSWKAHALVGLVAPRRFRSGSPRCCGGASSRHPCHLPSPGLGEGNSLLCASPAPPRACRTDRLHGPTPVAGPSAHSRHSVPGHDRS
jgi:hypothetical protein